MCRLLGEGVTPSSDGSVDSAAGREVLVDAGQPTGRVAVLCSGQGSGTRVPLCWLRSVLYTSRPADPPAG